MSRQFRDHCEREHLRPPPGDAPPAEADDAGSERKYASDDEW